MNLFIATEACKIDKVLGPTRERKALLLHLWTEILEEKKSNLANLGKHDFGKNEYFQFVEFKLNLLPTIKYRE